MLETCYEDRTDGFEKKEQLLLKAYREGNLDLCLSLLSSMKDTVAFERQRQAPVAPVSDADDFLEVRNLPSEWATWAHGWQYCKAVAVQETAGLERRAEPVDVLVWFREADLTDPAREVRVAHVADGALREVISQVYDVWKGNGECACRVVFQADVPANGQSRYVFFYGNPYAERPYYATPLRVEGEGYGLDIENRHYTARLSRQTGQLERLTYRTCPPKPDGSFQQQHGLELFAGGEGHGEPPHIDWAHDYKASNRFQKFRVTNWSACLNYEVVRGPLCVQVRRWGFPHSPAHPLFTPARMHIDVQYTFYAGLPYFVKDGRMEMIQDFELDYLRDDEWVFYGYSFDETLWMDREGKPAAIYAGLSDPRHTYIAVARDNRLSSWEKPYPVLPKGGPDGKDMGLLNDPDCFRVGDTYYAYSASDSVLLCKSTDLVNWTYVGPFLQHDMPDVAIGEDISCANFFQLGNKWMLLCISHFMGCRYYLGDWDAGAEQFVPQIHGRMNWRRPGQSITDPVYRDFFAPESVLTPDGRRIMWAWLATLDPAIDQKTVQSLPRELSLHEDGELRIQPLRELESLRYEGRTVENIVSLPSEKDPPPVAELDGDSFELRIRIDRCEAERRRIGLHLFAGGNGGGMPVLIRPESGTLCVGDVEAPFAVADLPEGEDVDLRIFIDKYLVEVFVNGRQAALNACMGYQDAGTALKAYCFHGRERVSAKIRKVEIWQLKPANQGFMEAQSKRIWEPDTHE